MVSGTEIMQSILEDMKKYDKEFKDNDVKIAKLEQEYVAEMRKLQTRQEQLRGLYTGLYEQYQKFANEREATTTVDSSDDSVEVVEEAPDSNNTVDIPEDVAEESHLVEAETADSLTESEKQNIEKTLEENIDKLKKSVDSVEKDAEIPDYLK